MTIANRPFPWKIVFLVVISFLAYYTVGRLGLELATINKQASPVWPATGVAMGVMLLFGPWMAIGVFAGAFLTNFQTGLNLPATFAIAAGNTLESLFFLWAFSRAALQKNYYGVHTRAILGIFILVLSTAISASVGTVALWGSSVIPLSATLKNWITWWIGDFLGALFIVMSVYKFKLTGFRSFQIKRGQILKLVFLVLFAVFLCSFVFSTGAGKPFLFLIFLIILLAAHWFDSAWVYLASLAICSFAVWRTIEGFGPFSGSLLNDRLIHLQIFLAGLGLTALGIGSLKQEGFGYRPKWTLLFGWTLSGLTFYFSYVSTASKDQNHFISEVNQSKEAIESRMNDYIQMLESGVSFFNASEYVSRYEWQLFANKLLSTNRYPGIEGVGVIFSSSIGQRFKNDHSQILRYQPHVKTHPVSNILAEMAVSSPEDNFVIDYLEPAGPNRSAIGLNISTERHRYEAALRARDSGMPAITEEIQLVQDRYSRPGFLIYAPIYKAGADTDSLEGRRSSFLGFVYAPVVFEKFMKSAIHQFEDELTLTVLTSGQGGSPKEVYSSGGAAISGVDEMRTQSMLGGRNIEIVWRKSLGFESSASLVSSWIGFFGTLATLFLAVMLSSLQHLTVQAQQIANEMTKEVNVRKRNWQALTETSPVGIYMTDKSGKCTYVNPTWCRMTGMSAEMAYGPDWIKVIHPEDWEIVSTNWRQMVSGGIFACRYRYVRPDGTIIHVAGQATPLKDENNEITGYFGTAQDITELYQNQMAVLASSRMSSLGQMASGIAHEINNPLTIIQGRALFLDKIIDAGSNLDLAKAKLNIKQIQATVQRIAKIIRGLQSFARDTSAEAFERVSIRDSLEDTLELCQERFAHHEVKLVTPNSADLDWYYWGRKEQISQVLLNLINNAFDAANGMADKWVRVDVTKEDHKILIAVSDSGPGISAGLQTKIFDPFFTTKEVGKGTGLGLSISRGIMDRHRGRLFFDGSRVQTTFVVELPLVSNQAENDLV